MKYYNYTDLGIVSPKKPYSNHHFIETTETGYEFIIVDSADISEMFYSGDFGATWTQITTTFIGDNNYEKTCLYHYRPTGRIYILMKSLIASNTNLYSYDYDTGPTEAALGAYNSGTANDPMDVIFKYS